MTRLAAFPFLALAALAACAPPVGPPSGDAEARRTAIDSPPRGGRGSPLVIEASATGAERDFAAALLARLQSRSFAENREYCGYIGLSAAGEWVSTTPVAGSEAACPLPHFPPGMRVAASYHTHGTYSPYYASEWPTVQDLTTDAADGIDGYIATPGGRLWHVDSDSMSVREICGRGCLPQDPAYVAAEDGPLRPVMTYRQLLAWERSIGGPF